jgi:hypothetical protein
MTVVSLLALLAVPLREVRTSVASGAAHAAFSIVSTGQTIKVSLLGGGVNVFFTLLSQAMWSRVPLGEPRPTSGDDDSLRQSSVCRHRFLRSEAIVAEIEFNTPVRVALGPEKSVRVVSCAIEAIECLSNIYWPKVAKRSSLEAQHVCMQAWRGYRSAEDARQAFIAAARATDALIVGGSEPAGKLTAAEI